MRESHLSRTTENDIKAQVKDLLAIKGIFNYPLLQGMASYPGLPDRVMHYQGKVVYLEIKRPGGKLSKYQEKFRDQCRADGIPYWVVVDIEELDAVMQAEREQKGKGQ